MVLETNAKLKETKRYLARLIESSPDAVIFTDEEGNVVFFSERAEALLGYRAKDITGQSVSLLYGDDAGAKQVSREMRKHGGTIAGFESVMVGKDSSNIPVLISGSYFVGRERLERPTPLLSNLKMHLIDTKGQDVPGAVYAKVVGTVPGSSTDFSIRFTSSSQEIEAFLRARLSPVAVAEPV